ncbi:MAG TPA: hypothetical protein VJ603_01450 [Paucimonas sp.]|nr:hypothetical protein [Paucimonas sp.]HJW57192.1 hypothetical protein [Burkholderiaceae bacterium]
MNNKLAIRLKGNMIGDMLFNTVLHRKMNQNADQFTHDNLSFPPFTLACRHLAVEGPAVVILAP